jgi:hypothetical protein
MNAELLIAVPNHSDLISVERRRKSTAITLGAISVTSVAKCQLSFKWESLKSERSNRTVVPDILVIVTEALEHAVC